MTSRYKGCYNCNRQMTTKEKSTALVPAPESTPTSVVLWERQPGESSRSFTAFTTFRDLPSANRTLKAVQEIMYPGAQWAMRAITKWAKDHRWVERVVAWENELDRVRLAAQTATVETMSKRHIEAAQELLKKGLEALEKVKIEDLDAANIRLYIADAIKLERLARGQSTEKYDSTERKGLPDLSGYSEEDLRRLADLAERVVKGAVETKSD